MNSFFSFLRQLLSPNPHTLVPWFVAKSSHPHGFFHVTLHLSFPLFSLSVLMFFNVFKVVAFNLVVLLFLLGSRIFRRYHICAWLGICNATRKEKKEEN